MKACISDSVACHCNSMHQHDQLDNCMRNCVLCSVLTVRHALMDVVSVDDGGSAKPGRRPPA